MDDDCDQYLQDPTELQIKAAFMGPAFAVNRCIATLGPTGLRIAFLEEDTEEAPNFRAAVTMSPQDGIGLYKMLQSVLLDIDPERHVTADPLRQIGQDHAHK